MSSVIDKVATSLVVRIESSGRDYTEEARSGKSLDPTRFSVRDRDDTISAVLSIGTPDL